ncbi:MAG: RIP metalloprotease RseP [Flavobacteriales bacterium]|nr:RIP metalloprotease RseP [Flavobacteriales bacterium]MBL0046057.1 RIP metalloprotease RseP [Flavobacteriales bacterium]
MDTLITIGQLLLGLSILVALHEFGHFLPAKLFGMRVEKFYLFFDAPYALLKKKIGDTEYGIGSLPFGGYVKISGMIDESMDKEQKERMTKPPEPWEFRGKPVWQRLIVMVGGVTVNAILGFLILSMVLWVWGRSYIPLENMVFGIEAGPLMERQGFMDGDKVLEVPGHPVRTIGDVSIAILIHDAREVVVERKGERKTINLCETIQDSILNSGSKMQFGMRMPFYIDSIVPGANADKARSFRKGDHVMMVEEKLTPYFGDFIDEMQLHKKGVVEVTVVRQGHVVKIPVNVDSVGRVGLGPKDPGQLSAFTNKIVKEQYGFFASIPAGLKLAVEQLRLTVVSFKLIFRRSGVAQMSGLGGMAKGYGSVWDWSHFWEFTAFLSFGLAFLNILPIPALDGGHVLFLLYEGIARRPANPKVLEYAQMAGMAFLLTVIIAVNGHDIYKWVTGVW